MFRAKTKETNNYNYYNYIESLSNYLETTEKKRKAALQLLARVSRDYLNTLKKPIDSIHHQDNSAAHLNTLKEYYLCYLKNLNTIKNQFLYFIKQEDKEKYQNTIKNLDTATERLMAIYTRITYEQDADATTRQLMDIYSDTIHDTIEAIKIREPNIVPAVEKNIKILQENPLLLTQLFKADVDTLNTFIAWSIQKHTDVNPGILRRIYRIFKKFIFKPTIDDVNIVKVPPIKDLVNLPFYKELYTFYIKQNHSNSSNSPAPIPIDAPSVVDMDPLDDFDDFPLPETPKKSSNMFVRLIQRCWPSFFNKQSILPSGRLLTPAPVDLDPPPDSTYNVVDMAPPPPAEEPLYYDPPVGELDPPLDSSIYNTVAIDMDPPPAEEPLYYDPPVIDRDPTTTASEETMLITQEKERSRPSKQMFSWNIGSALCCFPFFRPQPFSQQQKKRTEKINSQLRNQTDALNEPNSRQNTHKRYNSA